MQRAKKRLALNPPPSRASLVALVANLVSEASITGRVKEYSIERSSKERIDKYYLPLFGYNSESVYVWNTIMPIQQSPPERVKLIPKQWRWSHITFTQSVWTFFSKHSSCLFSYTPIWMCFQIATWRRPKGPICRLLTSFGLWSVASQMYIGWNWC